MNRVTGYPRQSRNQSSAFENLANEALSQFGEQVVVERTPVIELNSSYGTSLLRDILEFAGSGAKDDINGSVTTGEIKLSTGATASSSALLRTAETGRYVPGFGAEIGMGIRMPTAPTGEQQATWGGRSPIGTNDRIYFGYDDGGLFVAKDRNGVQDVKVYQADWNLDNMNGLRGPDNPSRITLDIANGVIFQVDFTWYGYGQILWGVVLTIGAQQRFIPVHQEKDFGETSIETPNLEVFQEVTNGATTSNLDLYVGGRQYAIVGRYEPKFRPAGDVRDERLLGDGAANVRPLISFQRKSGFENRSVGVQNFNIINVGNNPCAIEIWIDCTLTAANFGTPANATAAETALDSDIEATAMSGGTRIFGGRVIAASGVGQSTRDITESLSFDLPDNATITLAAYGLGGATTVVSGFILREEW